MAIKYDELHKEKTAPTLTEQDKEVLAKLETYTDNAISAGYGNSPDLSVTLDSGEIDKIMSRLPFLRLGVVRAAWIELYRKEGWEIVHTPVKAQEKVAGRKAKVRKPKREVAEWIVKPAQGAK